MRAAQFERDNVIHSLMAWLIGFDLTGQMGLLLYWLPLGLCAYGYTARTFKRYRECCELRDAGKYFKSDTVGTLIGRAFVTLCPVMNLLAGVFDLGPRLFGSFFAFIGRAFDKPLVGSK